MTRWLYGGLLAALALAAPRPAQAFVFVRGDDLRSGDLVAVWVKNSFELIVNLGAIDQLHAGPVATFTVPTQFDSNLTAAKFTALAVPNPGKQFTNLPPELPPPLPDPNIGFTSAGDPAGVGYLEVGNAQAVLDAFTPAQTWLEQLNLIPAANGTDVIENTDGDALIATSLFASYTGVLGLGTDRIANQIAISTAVTVNGQSYSMPLYEIITTGDFSDINNIVFGTEVKNLGTLSGDYGTSGSATLSLVPEPGADALAAGALGALAALSSARAPRGSRPRAVPSRRR